jgi:hypothetical protein
MPKNEGALNATTELRVRQRVSVVHDEVAPEAGSARYLGDEGPRAGVSHLFGTLTGVGTCYHDGSRSRREGDPRSSCRTVLWISRVIPASHAGRTTCDDGCAGRARTLSHKSVGGT